MFVECKHPAKSSFKCSKVNRKDVGHFNSLFYACKSKRDQDHFITQYCKSEACKNPSKRKVTIKFHLRKKNQKVVRVYGKVFQSAIGIKQFRIQRVAKETLTQSNSLPTEKRGGDRKSTKFKTKTEKVIDFISKFKAIDLHYCRGKTVSRQYLPSCLSIRRIWKMYNTESVKDLKVSETFFRRIFNTKFNIGFSKPATDKCSLCESLKQRVKQAKVGSEKQKMITDLTLHKKRAREFHDLLGENKDGMITITFDCEKNLVLPKLAIQDAYFKTQLHLNTFGLVIGSSKQNLDPLKIHLFSWAESERKKSSNEISSAVYQILQTMDFNGIETLRLGADSCPGQNRNSAMIFMLIYFLSQKAPKNLREIQLVFPVRGHSYIPPDRVFAQIEKRVRNFEVIASKDEYRDIQKEFGTVHDFSTGSVYDFKDAAKDTLKNPSSWPFQITTAKRIYITRQKNGAVHIQGDCSYRSVDTKPTSILKRGKKMSSVSLELVPLGNSIKSRKLADVTSLLKSHYGMDWRDIPELKYYKDLIDTMESSETVLDEIQSETQSDCCEIPDDSYFKV